MFLAENMIPKKAIKRNTSPALSIKKLLVNSSEKSSISGSLIVLIQNFDE